MPRRKANGTSGRRRMNTAATAGASMAPIRYGSMRVPGRSNKFADAIDDAASMAVDYWRWQICNDAG